jgi:heterodisulfide reductase subunit C
MKKAENIKNGNVNITCEYCGGCGYHKVSCPSQKVTAFIPTLKGDEAEEFIRKADENVKAMRQRRCNNHVWRKHYLNGGKVCQVCGKAKEEPNRAKDVEP